MRFLIDTHILLWAALDSPRLRGSARQDFENPENSLVVSVTTMWDIGIKYSIGKLPLPVAPRDFFAREIATRRYEVIDVQRPHAEWQAELPFPADGHRDPFDRLLVSQAIVEGIPLLSGDGRLHAYTTWGLVLRR